MAALSRSNLTKRNGVYYLRKLYQGKRYNRSLSTGDKEIAWQRARQVWRAITQERFDALEDTKLRNGYAKVGDVIAKYLQLVPNYRRPSAATASRNVSRLRRVLQDTGVADPDAASTGILTGSLVREFAECKIPKGNNVTQVDREQAMRNVSSVLLQARSVFSKRFQCVYERELHLPNLQEFLNERPCDNPKVQREEYSAGEIAILEAGPELREKRADLYTVWMLGYYLGLRAGEMVAARWTWFERTDDRWELVVSRRPNEGFDPKGYSGWVPVADDVYAELLSLRTDLDPYILPGGNKTNRRRLVERELATWMRDKGWTRMHCSHELRAYCGQRWRDAYGLEVARDWMRHKDARTTQDHYTVNHNTSQPPITMEA